MDNKLTPYDLKKIGFRVTISFEFVRNSVKNFNPKVEDYFFQVLRNLWTKNPRYIDVCDFNIGKIINELQDPSCTFDLFRVESEAALPDVLKIVDTLKAVYDISDEKDEFVELKEEDTQNGSESKEGKEDTQATDK